MALDLKYVIEEFFFVGFDKHIHFSHYMEKHVMI